MIRIVLFLFSFLLARLALDIGTIIENLRDSDEFNETANDPRVQFVGPRGPYLLATVLPEVPQDSNKYDEEDFELLTEVIASDVDAYSPPVVKRGAERQVIFEVELGDSGVALQMSPKDYSNLVKMIGRNASMQSMADVVMNFNGSLINATTTYNEVNRAAALIDGLVNRVVGNVTVPIAYPEATGQRQAVVAAWSTNTVDPMTDLFAVKEYATDLGYSGIARIISTQKVMNILTFNEIMMQRSGGVITLDNNTSFNRSPSESRVRGYLQSEGFPEVELYDLKYRDQDGSYRFIPDDCMIFIFTTQRPNEVALDIAEEDGRPIIPAGQTGNTVGYVGIGTTAGHEDRGPGRFVQVVHHDEVRPYVRGGIVQKSLPVFTEPNGFKVFTGIH